MKPHACWAPMAASAMVFLSGAAMAQLPSNVLVVRPTAPAGGNGLTWATAFNNLHDALDAASVPGATRREIWLTAGDFQPTRVLPGPPEFIPPFAVGGGVEVYGGFSGTETQRAQRNPGVNVTNIRRSTAFPLVSQAISITDGGVVDGVTIRPFPTSTFTSEAGANVGQGGTLRNSQVQGWTTTGAFAGLRVAGPDAVVEDVLISVNSSGTGANLGGGVAGLNAMDGTLRGLFVFNNNGSVRMVNSRLSASSFVSNSTACGVTGVVLVGSTAVNTIFRANQAALCPAIPTSNVAIHGGTLINCLVLGNMTSSSAVTLSGAVLVNSIVWDNCSASLGTCGKQQVASATEVRYSTVQNWQGTTQFGNSSADPLVDPNTLQLQPGSPAIDSGDTLAVPPGVQTDQIGRWRFVAAGGSALGSGPSPRVDRGPLEFGDTPVFCYANIDQSTGVPALTPADFVAFLGLYRAGHPVANCDGSTVTPVLSPADFVCFLQQYRAGCP